MRQFILGSLLTVGICFSCSLTENNFTHDQKQVLYDAYEFGNNVELKHYNGGDLGYVFAAIAWQETCAGVRVQNSSPGHHAYGVFQIYLPTAMTRAKRANLGISKADLKALLIEDSSVSASFARMEIEDWDKYHKGNLRNMLASYFGGFSWKKHYWYANAVTSKLEWLKKEQYFETRYDNKGFILNENTVLSSDPRP